MRERGGEARSRRDWLKGLVILALAARILGLSPAVAADETRYAALTTGTEPLPEADLPTVLSAADAARYHRIFALQAQGRWAAADHEIARLDNRLLLGEVLAERYRDQRYHPSYAQLARWLHHYADQPDAKPIYEMAQAYQPEGAPAPKKPEAPIRRVSAAAATASADHLTTLADRIRTLARHKPAAAAALLATPAAERQLDARLRDRLRADIAQAYRAAGEEKSPPESAAATVAAHWQAGLDDWQRGRFTAAGRHFERAAKAPGQKPWARAAAAFWAARVAEHQHQSEHTAYWLGIAAEAPRTFYGLLARRILGVDTYLNFTSDPFTVFDADVILGRAGGRRALALLAAGEPGRASAELHYLAAHSDAAVVESVEALADRANLPSLSLELAGVLADSDGQHHDYALYPVPRWQPLDGFSVDRALLFALMRQESLFLPRVKSAAGARGLMQLMPATARSMAARAGVDLGDGRETEAEDALADPELNLTLAQEYVVTLLGDEHIHDNLLLFACAYNSGPAAALHWLSARPEYRKDPLLFLESIPAPETRAFAKRVLANYWIYRQRLGQPSPDLDALAAGQWPTYIAYDSLPEEDRRDAENR